jgi:hypothetical protein
MNGLLANPVISGLLSGGPNAIRAAAEQQRLALAPRGGGGMSGAPGAIVTQDRSGADLGAGLAGLGEGLRAFGQMREKSQQEEARRSFVEGVVGIDPEAQKAALAANGGPTRAAAAAVNAAPNQRLTQLGVPENMQSYVRDLASRGMHNEAYEILSQFAKPRPAGDGFTLKPGEQRFDAQGRPIASGGEEPIDYNKLLIPDPNNPGRPMLNQAYLDARALIAKSGAPTVNVNNADNKFDVKSAELIAADELDFYKEKLSLGSAAAGSLFNFDMMLNLLNKGDINGGQFVLGAVETMRSVGIPDSMISKIAGEGAVDLAAFNGILSRQVLQDQLKQKGPQTESDGIRLQKSVANIDAPVEANQILLRSARSIAALDLAQKNFAVGFRRQSGDYNVRGIREKMDEIYGNMPFYVEKTVKLDNGSTARQFIFWDEFTSRYQEKNNVNEMDALNAWKSFATDMRRGK